MIAWASGSEAAEGLQYDSEQGFSDDPPLQPHAKVIAGNQHFNIIKFEGATNQERNFSEDSLTSVVVGWWRIIPFDNFNQINLCGKVSTNQAYILAYLTWTHGNSSVNLWEGIGSLGYFWCNWAATMQMGSSS